MVILTYKRVQSLMEALKRLKGCPFLNKVLVVWNDPAPPASDLLWPRLGVPLEVGTVWSLVPLVCYLPPRTVD